MAFYKPINIVIDDTPVIVYPCYGVESILDRKEHNVIQEHVLSVYKHNLNKLKTLGQYNIDILWDYGNFLMTDIWTFDPNWSTGALVDEKTFKNIWLETNKGVTAGDGLILLGEEEKLKRTIEAELGELGKNEKSLFKYIYGPRPELPFDLTPKESFYL